MNPETDNRRHTAAARGAYRNREYFYYGRKCHMIVMSSQNTGNTTICVQANSRGNIKIPHYWPFVRVNQWWSLDSSHKGLILWKVFPCHNVFMHCETITCKTHGVDCDCRCVLLPKRKNYVTTIDHWSIITIWHLRLLSHVRPERSSLMTLRWRHNGHDSVSNHQPREGLLKSLIRCRSKKTSKTPRHWPLCGEFTGDQWIPRTKDQ